MEGKLDGNLERALERAKSKRPPPAFRYERDYYFVAGAAGVAEVAAVVFFAVFAFL